MFMYWHKNIEYRLKEGTVLHDFLFMHSNLDTLNNYMLLPMCLIDFNDIKVAEWLQMKFLTQQVIQ